MKRKLIKVTITATEPATYAFNASDIHTEAEAVDKAIQCFIDNNITCDVKNVSEDVNTDITDSDLDEEIENEEEFEEEEDEGISEEEEWMEMHPHGWWNSPTDKGIDIDDDSEEEDF